MIADLFVRFFYYRRPFGRLVRCGSYGRSKGGIDHVTIHVGPRTWYVDKWQTGRWRFERPERFHARQTL